MWTLPYWLDRYNSACFKHTTTKWERLLAVSYLASSLVSTWMKPLANLIARKYLKFVLVQRVNIETTIWQWSAPTTVWLFMATVVTPVVPTQPASTCAMRVWLIARIIVRVEVRVQTDATAVQVLSVNAMMLTSMISTWSVWWVFIFNL